MPDRLFVYGTLRRGFPHPMASRLAAEATHEGRALWRGRLFDLGAHPAAVASPDPAHVVHGDLYRVGERTLTWLDRYEELDRPPAPDWFVRRRTEVELAGGGVASCWIYRFEGAPPASALVSDGDYLRHRAAVR